MPAATISLQGPLWRGEGRWSGQAGEEVEGKASTRQKGAAKENWSTAGKGRHGPADEVGALGRMEICQELGRGGTGNVERE